MRALVALTMAVLLTGVAALQMAAAQDDSRTEAGSALERAGSVVIQGTLRERSPAGSADLLERAGSRLSGGALERAANRAASLERANADTDAGADAASPAALDRGDGGGRP